MNITDKERFERLSDVFSRNFRLTRLYAEYLERYPEVITSEMVDTLTEDGSITKEEALVALLSEIFALKFEEREDRALIMNYLTPSVRILDAEKYRNNPYYKNIKIDNVKDGRWELRREEYLPYRGVIAGDMVFGSGYLEYPPLGFFTERFEFPAVLEDGNEWMTLTPVDLDTCDAAIFAARGRVITFGLGLGYYAYMVSEKEDVESITVIEKSPEVIALFKKYILPQFPKKGKVRIICADAFEYAEREMPRENFDFAFVDTWRDASDGEPMYRRMKALEHLSPNTKFEYWIENFLISRIRALNFERLYREYDESGGNTPESFSEVIAELDMI